MTRSETLASEFPLLPSMTKVQTPSTVRVLAGLLLAMGLLGVIALIVTPWQQSIAGTGKVSALTPMERQQSIDAPVEGRVTRWHVVEGSPVKQGQLVVEISDNDPEILSRLEGEKREVVNRLEAAKNRALSLQERIVGLEGSRKNALSAGESRILMAAEQVRAAQRSLEASEATFTAARLNIERQKKLADKGLSSTRAVELAEMDSARGVAEVERSKATMIAAMNEKLAREADQQKIETDYQAMIQDARASLASAQAEIANVAAELQRMDVRLARQNTQAVRAPRDGTIFRLIAQPGSELVKSGEPLAILIPDAMSPTVELWVSGNDTPLVQPGDLVRLQFEGWPAIQFTGWPSVAVGTFGGVVSLVDPTDNGNGKFRILVSPDPKDDPWPSKRYLRQGVRANGWVLLKQVPLWFELWRQFNGFPVAIGEGEPAKDAKAKDGK